MATGVQAADDVPERCGGVGGRGGDRKEDPVERLPQNPDHREANVLFPAGGTRKGPAMELEEGCGSNPRPGAWNWRGRCRKWVWEWGG
ncbi:hypothetical protein WJX73_004349 [Symbiochloris irregularis]|uniref:Uncharacterized protein n=1 Tax=Symbiochloris irregularis TaxID=706552 RepID=A0AAW1NJE1_9CHLO